MRMKQLETIRGIILGGSIVSSLINETGAIDLEEVTKVCMIANNLAIMTGFHFEKLTKDYEEMESIYGLIINNIAELMECYGIQDDPVKIFAMFTYLYRSGYLSSGKDFKYSFNMKDFACLNGADVVRGSGVCRSISSMFTDVCNSIGLTASNVGVKVSSKALDMKEKLSPVDLKVEKNNKKIARLVSNCMSIFPLANHLVTIVNDGTNAYVFDPTNDIYMTMRRLGKYEFINNTGATMSYKAFSNFATLLFGQMESTANIFKLHRYSKMNKLSYEEYVSKYREVLELIKEKPEIIEALYMVNEQYYILLEELCNRHNGMIRRMIPLIPKKRSNK